VAEQTVPPETRYAQLGRDRLAYLVLGQGPPDLVFTMGSFSHVDMVWDDPQVALFLRRLASFSRLLRFDRRGTGASDPLPPNPLPAWEAYTEELDAVMDAAGSRRAALLANGPEAGPMALFFAGTRPEQTSALILADATARYLVADDYPIGFPSETVEAMIGRAAELWAPRPTRRATPTTSGATLVLHHRDFQLVPAAHGRYLAEHIPGARLVELQGDLPLWWDQQDVVLAVVEVFLVGARRSLEPTRVLATVLFTDIVGSTERAAEVGDRGWRDLLDTHDELAGRLVERWGGRLVKTTGDGILATSTAPAARSAARPRSGTSCAVNIAARIMATASAGEIVVSRTVRDLVAGSDVVLQDRGGQQLRGVEGEWELFGVVSW
jgi:class 3 adenylate cyclase